MKYDFDESVSRKGTDSLKWDGLNQYYGREDLLPLWVADMDFRTPPFIMDALRNRLDQGVLGYTLKNKGYFPAIRNWVKQRYNWDAEEEWIHFMPGVVPGISLVLNYFTQPGDKILVQPPVYHPFHLLPTHIHREVVWNPLRYENGKFHFDETDFKQKIQGCKIFLLCHPHNPGGKVWTRDELERMAELCKESGTLVISDEIHADLTFPSSTHIPFATVSEAAKRNSITFHAPSKVFNMPGLACAHTLIPNPEIREPFYAWLNNNEFAATDFFSTVAVTAAYTHGTEWLDQMLAYVQENILFLEDFCQKRIPQIKPIRPQASYLVFLDCRDLGLSRSELAHFFTDKAHLALNEGGMFGKEGEGFMRINAGCPRSLLNQALVSLERSIKE